MALRSRIACNGSVRVTAIHFYYIFPFSPSFMRNCFYLTKKCLSGSNYLVLNWQPVIQRNLVIFKAIWKSSPPSWRIPIKNQKCSFSIDTKKWKFLNWALEAFGWRGRWNSISKNKGKPYWWVLWHESGTEWKLWWYHLIISEVWNPVDIMIMLIMSSFALLTLMCWWALCFSEKLWQPHWKSHRNSLSSLRKDFNLF